jgi:hypothetical protein
MAPGDYNGKNYGGGHTGRGDFRKGGPYANNGKHNNKRMSHLDFKPGTRVSYFSIKSRPKIAFEGVVADRPTRSKKDTIKYSKSFIPVIFDDDSAVSYIHKNSLTIVVEDNTHLSYNPGDPVVYTNNSSKLNGFTGKVVDKSEDKQNYTSYINIRIVDPVTHKQYTCYVHKNMVDLTV